MATSPTLIVYTDVKSPYAYLAKDLTHALEDELGITADWRHFTLDIPSYLGSAKVDDHGNVTEDTRTEHQWKRIKYAYMDARRRANLRGITLRGTQKIWDTSLVGTAFYRAKEAGPNVHRRFMQLVFEPFWKRELNVEDMAVVIAKLDEAGADNAGFADWAVGEGRMLHDRLRDEAWEAGVFGVPSFQIGEELFFGFEQLPMIRWRLTGRDEDKPDM